MNYLGGVNAYTMKRSHGEKIEEKQDSAAKHQIPLPLKV